jgi:CobQ-like glutamine amidotransferase family enzyme
VTATLRVAVVYPDLLGTYGDGGNGVVLWRRARWRGIACDLVQVPSDEDLPAADLYCLGGGEDAPQVQAARRLAADGTLARAVADGAVVLAVCAGFQVVGRSFPGAEGSTAEGLGLLPVETVRGAGPRAVGEVTARPRAVAGDPVALPLLTGFENHAGATRLDPRAVPLADVVAGTGNGDGAGTEGARSGRVLATYLHGPVLARNPALADLLLSWALDRPLDPLDDVEVARLRAERLAAAPAPARRP